MSCRDCSTDCLFSIAKGNTVVFIIAVFIVDVDYLGISRRIIAESDFIFIRNSISIRICGADGAAAAIFVEITDAVAIAVQCSIRRIIGIESGGDLDIVRNAVAITVLEFLATYIDTIADRPRYAIYVGCRSAITLAGIDTWRSCKQISGLRQFRINGEVAGSTFTPVIYHTVIVRHNRTAAVVCDMPLNNAVGDSCAVFKAATRIVGSDTVENSHIGQFADMTAVIAGKIGIVFPRPVSVEETVFNLNSGIIAGDEDSSPLSAGLIVQEAGLADFDFCTGFDVYRAAVTIGTIPQKQ